jgi:arylformamidase
MAWSPRIYDLTRPLNHDTLIALAGKLAVGDGPVKDLEFSWLRSWDEGDNGAQCEWTLNDHFGTHVDAPSHIVRDAAAVDQLDLRRLFGEAVVLDCSFARGRGLTGGDFARARPEARPGDIVLIYSGEQPGSADEYLVSQTYVTPDGAQWLVDAGVHAVGVEPFGFEHVYDGICVRHCYEPTVADPWPAHRIVLSAGIYIIEGLTNLRDLAGRRVRFCGLPLPVPNSSGSPIRAIAWEDEPAASARAEAPAATESA